MSMNNVFAQNSAETTKATVSQDSLNFETIEITMDKSIEGYITSPKGDYYGMIVNKEVDKKNRHINTLSIYSTSTRQKLWQITYKSMRVSECDTLLTGSFTKMLSGDNYYVKTSEKEFAPIGTLTNNVAAYTSKHKIVEVGIRKTTPSTLCYPNQLYSTICKRNGKAFIIGDNNGTTELWCIRDGKAIKMYDDVVSTNLKDNTLEVLTNNGKLYLLNLL